MSCLDQLSSEARYALVSTLYQKQAFFWIGSGFSRNFGYPTWQDVIEGVAAELDYQAHLEPGQPLRSAELLFAHSTLKKGYDENQFNALVAITLKKLREKGGEPEWVDDFKEIAPELIVTTNWDTVLEELFEYLPNVVVRGDQHPKISKDRRNILKIHGDVGRPPSIVITSSQYNRFQREDTYLNRKIYTLFSEGTPVFIGYSLSDPNVSFLYEEVYAHFGENKSPAFMIVDLSTSNEKYDEAQLLFSNKQVHLIKAGVAEFIFDVAVDLEDFLSDTRQFWLDFENIEDKLKNIISFHSKGKRFPKNRLFKYFPGKASGHQAITAMVQIMEKPSLYAEAGGNLLTPDISIPYQEANYLIQNIISLLNEYRRPSTDILNRFHSCVFDSSTTGPGVWDFYQAKAPFKNLLAIRPRKNSSVFVPRLEHIRGILKWSSPSQIGKCWGTWSVFKKHLDWFTKTEIDGLVKLVEDETDGIVDMDDMRWLRAIKDAPHINNGLQDRIEELL